MKNDRIMSNKEIQLRLDNDSFSSNSYVDPYVLTPGFDMFKPKSSEIVKLGDQMSSDFEKLRVNIILLQGYIQEIQRASSKENDFNEYLYDRTNETIEVIEKLKSKINGFNEQLDFSKDIVESLKTSQCLTEGFKEKSEKRHLSMFDINTVDNHTINAIHSNDDFDLNKTFHIDMDNF